MSEKKLTKNQLLALSGHIEGKTVKEIAKQVGVKPITVNKWRELEHYRSEYNRLTKKFKDSIESRILDLQDKAFEVLEKSMMDYGVNRQNARIAAMKIIDITVGNKSVIDTTVTVKRDPEEWERFLELEYQKMKNEL